MLLLEMPEQLGEGLFHQLVEYFAQEAHEVGLKGDHFEEENIRK
jgi:hypothetical protein